MLAKLRDAGADIEVGEDWIAWICMANVRRLLTYVPRRIRIPDRYAGPVHAVEPGGRRDGFITETVFENRFMHVPELSRWARTPKSKAIPLFVTVLKNFWRTGYGNRSACISKPGAGWCIAEGTTVVDRIYHIDRGYDALKTNYAL